MLNTIGKQFAHPNGICGRLATKVMNLMNHKMYDMVLMHLQTTEARTILDVGFGNAQVLKKALRLHSGTYYGVEISETMIKKARQDKALQGTELVYGKVEELPFQDEMFAYQYSINTIYFW